MRLKKIASVVAAAAMALTLSMPAFAEATPGEIANELGQTVAEQTAALRDASGAVTVSAGLTSQALQYFDLAEEQGLVSAVSIGDNLVYRCDNGVTINATCTVADDYTVTIDATANGDSAHGYALTVRLPMDCNVTAYGVSETTGAVNFQATAVVQTVDNQFKMATFWVPHFTTYVLTPVTTTGSDGEGGGNGGSGSTTTTSTSTPAAASTTAPAAASTTVSAENPIKATGASMDMTLFVVVALAAAAVCGMGVAVKKSRKGE